MTSTVPNLRLKAEALSWIFASRNSFRLHLLELKHNELRRCYMAHHHQYEYLLKDVHRHSKGRSLEEIKRLIEYVIFDSNHTQTVSIEQLLYTLSKNLLTIDAGHLQLDHHAHKKPHVTVEFWRWLSLRMPTDFLAVAYHVTENLGMPHDDRIHLGNRHLDHVLFEEENLTNTHLHLSGALPFPDLWTGLMGRLMGRQFDVSKIKSSPLSTPPFGNVYRLHRALLAAALARVVLAMYLHQYRTMPAHADSFRQYCKEIGLSLSRPEQDTFFTMLHWLEQPSFDLELQEVTDLDRTDSALWQNCLNTVVVQYIQYQRKTHPEKRDDVLQSDPLYHFATGAASPEAGFIYQCLQHIRKANPDHKQNADLDLFRTLFWQEQRIRNILFRYLTQEPGVIGLDWFSIYFKRLSAFRGQSRYQTAILGEMWHRRQSRHNQTHNVTQHPISVEFRVSPPEGAGQSLEQYIRHVRQIPETLKADKHDNLELGLILHFQKEEFHKQKHTPHSNPAENSNHRRFYDYLQTTVQRTLAQVSDLIAYDPTSINILRGIDICSLEQAMPNWIFFPALRQMRQISTKHAFQEYAMRPLQFTMHVGEDFCSLGEALRRMDEPLLFDVFKQHDRFGLALALGTEPQKWVSRHPIFYQRREDRLDDLLWEYHVYSIGRIKPAAGRETIVRQQIFDLLVKIYQDTDTPIEQYIKAWEYRHKLRDYDFLERPKEAFQKVSDKNTSEKNTSEKHKSLFYQYLTDADIWERGQHCIEVVCTEGETVFWMNVQKKLREDLTQRNIAIEINPSSNLVTADMNLRDHPVFHMYPPHAAQMDDGQSSLAITIGDDDPLTFATCLYDEYCYLYYAALACGYDQRTVLAWIREMSRQSWRHRFTVGWE